MFRILIVDDEPSVVDAIAQTMPWQELDVEEVFCAYSAKEALRIAEHQFIDIVLTDIRMPGMNGIELMQHIRTYSYRVQFILLTGHAEFEFAQQALRLQSADYLLKPVRDEVLEQAIRKLTTTMREQWTEISSHRTTIQYVQENLPTLRSDLLRNLLEGRIRPEQLAEKLELLRLPYQEADAVYPTVVRIQHNHYEQTDRALIEYSIMNIAEEVIGPQYHLWYCYDIHGYLVILLKAKENIVAGRENDSVSRILMQWQHMILHYVKANISVVYGVCAAFSNDLPDIYESAVHTIRRRIGNDTGLLLTAGQSDVDSSLRTASILHAPPSLSHLFTAGMWEDAKNRLQSIFSDIECSQEASIDVDFLAEIYHTVLSACYHYAHSNGQSVAQALNCEENLRFYQSPELLQSVSMLKQWVFEVCDRLSMSNLYEIQDARELLIQQIQEFIHVNLADDVSLMTIANHVHLHPVYLSKVYKLVTGEGLKDYLSRLRLERAMQLLPNKNLKIYEISSQIGYLNTAYFIKVFKKTYGVTPQEYRESQ